MLITITIIMMMVVMIMKTITKSKIIVMTIIFMIMIMALAILWWCHSHISQQTFSYLKWIESYLELSKYPDWSSFSVFFMYYTWSDTELNMSTRWSITCRKYQFLCSTTKIGKVINISNFRVRSWGMISEVQRSLFKVMASADIPRFETSCISINI